MQSIARVFVVDDQRVMRQGLRQLIRRDPGLTDCGEAADPSTALRGISQDRPDVVIVDFPCDGGEGLDLVESIHGLHPELPVLVLTTHDEVHFVERTLRAGASGYLMKHEAGAKVLDAIQRLLGGQIYVSDEVAPGLLKSLLDRGPQARHALLDMLSKRELEVFHLTGKGLRSRQIADYLGLSVKTIESHRANIKGKLGLRNARELTLRARRWVVSEREN